VCTDGDFAIANDDNGHQMSSAIAIKPKTSHCILGKIFSIFFIFFLYVIAHYCWISQFGKISLKKNTITNLLRCVGVNFTNLLVFSIPQICWNVGSTNH
jgi:predicted permease